MKINRTTKLLSQLSLGLILILMGQNAFGQVKIGDDAENVNPYAILELESKRLGVIWPSMTSAERDTAFQTDIPNGLTIYNTDEQCIQYWDQQQWRCASSAAVNNYDSEAELPTTSVRGTLAQVTTNAVVSLHYFNGQEWMSVFNGTTTSSGTTVVSPTNSLILTGNEAPSNTATATRIESITPGALYVNTSNGQIYIAVDNGYGGTVANDGRADNWEAFESEGTPGPAGPRGSAGAKGLDGQGLLIGSTSPPTTTVSSPTLYIDSVSGKQYTNSGGSTWELLPTAKSLTDGTQNYATLHWDGSEWVENTALTAGATDTTINVSNDISLTAGNLISLTTSASLESGLLDNNGRAGQPGEVLTVSGTQVLWSPVTTTGLASGTLPYTTLHWNGVGWVENTALTAGATDTTVTVNNDIALNAEHAITLTTTNTTVNASNNINLTADNAITLTATTTIQGGSITANATGNTDISATETLTLAAGNTIALTTTASLDKALLDSTGSPGQNGQVLASTSTQTVWITMQGATVTETTTDYLASVNDGTIVVRPTAAATITLPSLASEDVGKIVTIKRGNAYTITPSGTPENPLEVIPSGGTIDGTSSLKLNLSYQGYTLQALASGNWTIIQRF